MLKSLKNEIKKMWSVWYTEPPLIVPNTRVVIINEPHAIDDNSHKLEFKANKPTAPISLIYIEPAQRYYTIITI